MWLEHVVESQTNATQHDRNSLFTLTECMRDDTKSIGFQQQSLRIAEIVSLSRFMKP